jgi:hypothetical protein
VFTQFDSASIVRRELYARAESLKEIEVTSIVKAERQKIMAKFPDLVLKNLSPTM